MDKWAMIYSHNGIQLGSNMEESEKYYAEQKKPVTKEYLLYDSIYMKL